MPLVRPFADLGSREEIRLHLLAIRLNLSAAGLTDVLREIRTLQAKALVDCGVPQEAAADYIHRKNYTAEKILTLAEGRFHQLVTRMPDANLTSVVHVLILRVLCARVMKCCSKRILWRLIWHVFHSVLGEQGKLC
jgi:hypothetical protein